jgi:hypothetical protein
LALVLKNVSLFHSKTPNDFSAAPLQIDLLKYHFVYGEFHLYFKKNNSVLNLKNIEKIKLLFKNN